MEQAYADTAAMGQLSKKFRMTPHDFRGVATSLKALSHVTTRELMATGTWSSMNTFLKCYVKSFSRSELTGLCELGPFIAAGTCVTETTRPVAEAASSAAADHTSSHSVPAGDGATIETAKDEASPAGRERSDVCTA